MWWFWCSCPSLLCALLSSPCASVPSFPARWYCLTCSGEKGKSKMLFIMILTFPFMFCLYWIRGCSYLLLLSSFPVGVVPYLLCRALLQYFECFVQQDSLLFSHISHHGYWSPLPHLQCFPSLCALKYSISSEVFCSGLSLTQVNCVHVHAVRFRIHNIFLCCQCLHKQTKLSQGSVQTSVGIKLGHLFFCFVCVI